MRYLGWAREPGRQKTIPTRDQRKARIGAELETIGCDVVAQQQDDGEGSEEAENWNVMKALAERLWDGGSHVDSFGRTIREDRSGSKDVEEGDNRRGDKAGTSNVAAGVAAFAGKNGHKFEGSQAKENHLSEDAEIG